MEEVLTEILGVIPTIIIPKPIGGRIIIVPVTTTLTIEEQYKRAGLIGVAAEKERPRNTLGVIVKISIDPLIQENFQVGQGVYFAPLSGTELTFEGKIFRSLEFNEIISTLEESDLPEPYKDQVRQFLTNYRTIVEHHQL